MNLIFYFSYTMSKYKIYRIERNFRQCKENFQELFQHVLIIEIKKPNYYEPHHEDCISLRILSLLNKILSKKKQDVNIWTISNFSHHHRIFEKFSYFIVHSFPVYFHPTIVHFCSFISHTISYSNSNAEKS